MCAASEIIDCDLKQFITQSWNFNLVLSLIFTPIDGWFSLLSFLLFEGFSNMCTCCPISKSSSTASTSTTCSTVSNDTSTSPSSSMNPVTLASSMSPDARTSSVAELRRKAQEHSAALLHSLHAVAVSGLSFPGLHFPPLSLQKFSDHYALSNRNKNGHHHHASDYISDLSLQHNNNNNTIISKVEPNDKVESVSNTANKNTSD